MSYQTNEKYKTEQSNLPRHVAIIMDGNGRWAETQGKLRILGHKAGVKAVRKAITFALDHNLDALTLYAFSSENWNRPKYEVSGLIKLFIYVLNTEIKNLHKYNIKLRIIGDINPFSAQLQSNIRNSEKLTSKNNRLTLNIAVNYGGRWDIVQSVKKIAIQVQKGILNPLDINEDIIYQYICMHELAPVDLVIRTGGEHRISNFLLWQIAYAELFFTDILWPDFNDAVFQRALNSFAQRKRRFGKII
ncbi:polyprenyl diphosphate synthase [Blochmannia endosymbiont of Polyrhachis (Hedomyrma) turneri]|uniref:polyprenyl diphosphate synthase n=1 Tax=Blochmannia endosymbiont of Polyrhachis (Hedomyrma) turneri TaxID=1505596 RepID=UPI0023B781FB|nr:polyprenyl diphosphate synthase [Blochmannia endosymbiont of Polyrhachis (Hedomyrma) turneri]